LEKIVKIDELKFSELSADKKDFVRQAQVASKQGDLGNP
jgi:hypothetical protein